MLRPVTILTSQVLVTACHVLVQMNDLGEGNSGPGVYVFAATNRLQASGKR